MSEQTFDAVAHLRGILGMVVGAVAGYFVYVWLVGQGFYALVLPGAMLGLGCGYASQIRSPWLAAIWWRGSRTVADLLRVEKLPLSLMRASPTL